MDFADFEGKTPEEMSEQLMDMLAEITAIWDGDAIDDVLMRSLVGAMRSMSDAAVEMQRAMAENKKPPNPYVMGLWGHAYRQMLKNWPTVATVTDQKRRMS